VQLGKDSTYPALNSNLSFDPPPPRGNQVTIRKLIFEGRRARRDPRQMWRTRMTLQTPPTRSHAQEREVASR